MCVCLLKISGCNHSDETHFTVYHHFIISTTVFFNSFAAPKKKNENNSFPKRYNKLRNGCKYVRCLSLPMHRKFWISKKNVRGAKIFVSPPYSKSCRHKNINVHKEINERSSETGRRKNKKWKRYLSNLRWDTQSLHKISHLIST